MTSATMATKKITRTRRLFIAGLAAIATVVAGLSLPTAAWARAEPAYQQIVNRYSDQCLDVWGASTEHAANVGVWRCVGADNQLWYFQEAGTFYVPSEQRSDKFYYVRVRHTGMCLNVAYWGQADGADVVQANCSNGTNEQWRLKDMGGGYYQLRARHSDKCLDKTWSGDVVQWQCWGQGETWQHWRRADIA
jgi:hypothetical protein